MTAPVTQDKRAMEDALIATFKACVDTSGDPLVASFKGWPRDQGYRFLARAALGAFTALQRGASWQDEFRAWLKGEWTGNRLSLDDYEMLLRLHARMKPAAPIIAEKRGGCG